MQLIRTGCFALGLLACFSRGAGAQPVVSNIRVEADGQRLKVVYDLAGAADQDSVYLLVESRARGVLKTRTVTGDVGRHLAPGVNKVIYWDYGLDGERLTDELRPTVGVVETKKSVVYTGPPVGSGPGSALASVLLPGVGNILVQPDHKIGWRPLITVGYAGLFVYGLVEQSRSHAQLAQYNDPAYTHEQDAQPFYDQANALHKHAVVAFRTAAVVLVADVVYSLIRGARNARQVRTFKQQVTLNYVGHTPLVGMKLVF